MKSLINIKLNNGEELLAKIVDEDDTVLTIENPVQVDVSPENGIFCKSWLLLSESNIATLNKDAHIFFTQKASDIAVSYYDEFLDRIEEQESELDFMDQEELDEGIDHLEEVLTTLLESKKATRH